MTQPNRFHVEVNVTALAGNLFAPAHGQLRACAVLTGPLTSVKEQATAYPNASVERGFLALASIIARSAKAAATRANLKPVREGRRHKGRRISPAARPRPCKHRADWLG